MPLLQVVPTRVTCTFQLAGWESSVFMIAIVSSVHLAFGKT